METGTVGGRTTETLVAWPGAVVLCLVDTCSVHTPKELDTVSDNRT